MSKVFHYYNDNDSATCAWVRELIARRLIPDGEVDSRSIIEVQSADLRRFTQCHFFCGIAIWPLALRIAGVSEERRIWTGSAPCQPWSVAGKGEGEDDERHLWPHFFRLIRESGPTEVIGEQVSSPDAVRWLDGVSSDLESAGYAFGALGIGAHSAGADHIRQRLYWGGRRVANAEHAIGRTEHKIIGQAHGGNGFGRSGPDGIGLGFTDSYGQQTRKPAAAPAGHGDSALPAGSLCPVAVSGSEGLEGHGRHGGNGDEPGRLGAEPVGPVAACCPTCGGMGNATGDDQFGERLAGPGDGRSIPSGGPSPWGDSYWIPCRDGKARRVPVEPRLFPLADAGQFLVPGMARRRTIRPHLLRAAGNAIVAPLAATFIQAFLQTEENQ